MIIIIINDSNDIVMVYLTIVFCSNVLVFNDNGNL